MKNLKNLLFLFVYIYITSNMASAQSKIEIGKKTIKVPGEKVVSDFKMVENPTDKRNFYAEINAKTFTFTEEKRQGNQKSVSVETHTINVAEAGDKAIVNESKIGEIMIYAITLPTNHKELIGKSKKMIKTKSCSNYFSDLDCEEYASMTMDIMFNNKADADKLCAEINKVLESQKK